jgi:hypothetical protein
MIDRRSSITMVDDVVIDSRRLLADEPSFSPSSPPKIVASGGGGDGSSRQVHIFVKERNEKRSDLPRVAVKGDSVTESLAVSTTIVLKQHREQIIYLHQISSL